MRKILCFLVMSFCWISLANSAPTNTPTPIPALYMYVPATGSPTWNPGLIRYRKNIPPGDVIGLTDLMRTATPVPTNTPIPSNTPDDRWATITPVLPTYQQRQAMEQPGFTPNATDHYMCQTDRAFGGNLGVVEYTNPWYGIFNAGATAVTGTMKITLPVGYSAAATNYVNMDILIRPRIPTVNSAFRKLSVGFSVHSSGVTNMTYTSIGGTVMTNLNDIPRISYDGSKLCILIGVTTSVRSVPYEIFIEKIKATGNGTVGWDNRSGYSLSSITSESGYITSLSSGIQWFPGAVNSDSVVASTYLESGSYVKSGSYVRSITDILSGGYVQSATGWLFGDGSPVTSSISDAGVSTAIRRIDSSTGPITISMFTKNSYGTGLGANPLYLFWKSSADTNAVAFNSGATTCTFADGATTLMTNALVNQNDYIAFVRSYVTGLGASNGATIRWIVTARGNANTGEGFQYTPTPILTYTPVPTATPHETVIEHVTEIAAMQTVQVLAQQTIDAHSTQIANQGTTQATHGSRISELEKTATPQYSIQFGATPTTTIDFYYWNNPYSKMDASGVYFEQQKYNYLEITKTPVYSYFSAESLEFFDSGDRLAHLGLDGVNIQEYGFTYDGNATFNDIQPAVTPGSANSIGTTQNSYRRGWFEDIGIADTQENGSTFHYMLTTKISGIDSSISDLQNTPTPVWTYTPVPTATPYGVLTCTSVSAAGATFGTSPNFTNFESDGTFLMNGNSTVWDDIQFIATSGKVPASHYPAWTTWNGDFSAYTFAVDDYIDLGAKEVMHGYKEGTDLYPHLHWVVNGTDVNARSVKWELVYSTSPSSESSPYTYVFPAPQTLSAEVTLQAGVTDRTSIYQEMGTISGSGLKTGSLIRLRIRRVTAAGTAPTNNPFGFEVGVHAELDTIGSRTRTGK